MKDSEGTISVIDALKAYLKIYPNEDIKTIIDIIGIDKTAKICAMFAGRSLSFPSRSTLKRYSIVALVNDELKWDHQGSEYEKKVAKLARILRKKKSSIKAIHKTKRYHN